MASEPDRYVAAAAGTESVIGHWAAWTAIQTGIDPARCLPDASAPGIAQLRAIGGLLQEDVVLLSGDAEAGFPVIAGVVCFPSGWSIGEKLGKGMNSVHRPVAGYESTLARPTNRLMAGMHAERPVWRMNWGLRASDALDQSPPYEPKLARRESLVDASNAHERLWFRVERQTLVKLSGAFEYIVFAIHTHQTRMGDLQTDEKRLLLANLQSMPEASIRYKRLHPIMNAAVAALSRDVG